MNILIPMAGAGVRFYQEGYTVPKPFINVQGKYMIQQVIENLSLEGHYIFIVLKEHEENFPVYETLNTLVDRPTIITVDSVTDGAARTCLLAEDFINNDSPLLIANCDQLMDWDANEFAKYSAECQDDGIILTYTSLEANNSFVTLDENGHVIKAVEKEVISDIATCGVYFWKKGSDYVSSAKQMIEKNIRTNNEFYVCPTYNELIQEGKKISVFPIAVHYPIGTPSDLKRFNEEVAWNHSK